MWKKIVMIYIQYKVYRIMYWCIICVIIKLLEKVENNKDVIKFLSPGFAINLNLMINSNTCSTIYGVIVSNIKRLLFYF